jgi:hypothetical protein
LVEKDAVPRPTRTNEFKIYFESAKLSKSWQDLQATQLSHLVAAWEFLTKTPLLKTTFSYPLKDVGSPLVRNGKTFERWQLKLNQTNGSRIWYFVDAHAVFIEKIFTAHPNQTK